MLFKACLIIGLLCSFAHGKKNWDKICKRTLRRYTSKCLVKGSTSSKDDVCGEKVSDDKLKEKTRKMCRRTEDRTFAKCGKSCEPENDTYYPVSDWYDIVPWKNINDIDIKEYPLEIQSEGIVDTWKYITFQLLGPAGGEPPMISVAIKDNWIQLSGIRDRIPVPLPDKETLDFVFYVRDDGVKIDLDGEELLYRKFDEEPTTFRDNFGQEFNGIRLYYSFNAVGKFRFLGKDKTEHITVDLVEP